jgi:lysophospholipase
VLAHSTGALIALLGSHSMVNRVRRMVLVAPFLAFTGLPFSMKTTLRLTTALCWLGLGGLYAAWGPRQTTPFDMNKLTTDAARYRRNTRLYDTYPQLAQGGPTIAWVRAACQAVRAVQDPEFMAGIQVPILFIGAGAEEVVSVSAAAEYARRLRGGSLLMIDGARHEILQEADVYREQFFAAFDAYVPGAEEVFA